MFTIIPAIDLKGGHCVRLRQGRADDSTIYSDDPVGMARRWVELGASYLHIVDLDGAFAGKPVHHDVIGAIAAAVDVPVEVGGGLRTDEDIASVLKLGVARAIIGTRALEDPEATRAMAQRFGPGLAVGIDARDGMVQVKGWMESSTVSAVTLATSVSSVGVRTIIFTDISRDGMLTGVNAAAMDRVCAAVSCDVIASGGVSSPEDVKTLRSLGRPNLVGAIVGKALYDDRVTLGQLQEAALWKGCA